MKNQPFLSRLLKTAVLLLIWPLSILITASYLLVCCTLNIVNRVLEVWE